LLFTVNGITDSSDRRNASILRSPCNGAVLPKSASSAMSPLLRRSLGSLPSSLCLPTSDPPHAKRQLISPQITKWFRKSTPRKLNVTPKKSSISTHESKSTVTRVKRKLCSEQDADDSQEDNQLAVELEVGQLSQENDPKLSPSKRQRTEPSSAANVLSPVYNNCDKVLDHMPDKTLSDAGLVSLTAQTSIAATLDTVATSFHSPTVNLPNYVYDPQPRAPVGQHLSPVKCRQSRDWLTQLRLDRQNSTMQRSPTSVSPRGQTRHRTAKMLKSSPEVCQPSGSAVKTTSPAPNTEAVGNLLLFIDTAHRARWRVYVTVQCLSGSVCPIY